MRIQLQRGALLVIALAWLLVPLKAVPTVTIYENGVLKSASCLSVGPTTTCMTSDANFTILSHTGASTAPAILTVTGSVSPNVATATFPEYLTVTVYDTGFMAPIGAINLIQTANTNTPVAGEAPGSFQVSGFLDNTNVGGCATFGPAPSLLPTGMGTCTTATPTAMFSSFDVLNPGQITSTATVSTNPFALEEVLSYEFDGNGAASVTTTLSATVPEPAGIALLGGVLLFIVTAIRRRHLKVG